MELRIEARLDNRKNGLAVDADGNRYLTSLVDRSLTKVTPDGEVDTAWSQDAAIGVSNGITIEGDTAYVSQATDETVLLSVPLDSPGEATSNVLTAPPEPAEAGNHAAHVGEARAAQPRPGRTGSAQGGQGPGQRRILIWNG